MTYREGEDPSVVRRSPGQTEFGAITLERGVTHDAEFEHGRTRSGITGIPRLRRARPISCFARDVRKDIVIEVYNETGQKVFAYNVYRCWASITAMPELDGSETP